MNSIFYFFNTPGSKDFLTFFNFIISRLNIYVVTRSFITVNSEIWYRLNVNRL